MTNDSTQEETGWQRPTQTFHAHFDCFSGAAGDMMLAACLDAAGDAEQSERLLQHVTNCIEQGMPELKGEFGLETKIVWRGGMGSIAGRHVNVTSRYHHQAAPVPKKKASEDSHNHSHGHGHGLGHYHRDEDTEPSTDYSVLEADTDHSHGHEHSHSHSSNETNEKVGDSRSHSHAHSKSTEKDAHSHGHDHGHSHLHSNINAEDTKLGQDGHSHSHSHSRPDTSAETEKEPLPSKDSSNEDHNHDHSHGHSHGADDFHKGPLRNLPEIRKMLQDAPDQFIPPWVRETAISAFTELAQAEAMTHGAASMDAVHFHEVGAVDSIVDTVGTLVALYNLGVASVSCSRLPMGEGTVWTDHGLLPVPAPATLRLLVGMPLCQVSACRQALYYVGGLYCCRSDDWWIPPINITLYHYLS
jgi:uncharacterized protein (DUF111 family)